MGPAAEATALESVIFAGTAADVRDRNRQLMVLDAADLGARLLIARCRHGCVFS